MRVRVAGVPRGDPATQRPHQFNLNEIGPSRRYTVANSPVWAHPAVAPGALLIKDVDKLICWSLG